MNKFLQNRKLYRIFSTICLITLLLGFTPMLNPTPGNWYQQFMPNLGGRQIVDITFTDSLTGFAVASRNVNPDTASVLKTTNGGNNWQVIFTQTPKRFSRIQFINADTGFVCGGTGGGTPQLYKTIDGGTNWFLQSSFGCSFWSDMSVLNNDSIWLVDNNSFCGGVFYTSTGGASWVQQFSGGNQNPNKIYMYNARIGFMSNSSALPNIYKTTNGGASWTVNVSGDFFTDMVFTDSLTGWRCMPSYDTATWVKKTTNGGVTWIKQYLPTGGIILTSQIYKFALINKDTIWGSGGQVFYGGGKFRGILYKTTNSGNNWLFQIPDTSFQIEGYGLIEFINKNIGWANANNTGIHTTNGGDTSFIYGVQKISHNIPKEFALFQNYPNPFNPTTNIKYQITKSSNVNLKVNDITGKLLVDLVNQKQSAGIYLVDFNGIMYSSGVYFYSLIVNGVLIETKKMILIK